MKNLKLAIVLVVTGIVATACCCPCPLGGGQLPTGALPVSDRVMPRAPVSAPIAAGAPVVNQRF